MKNVSTKTMKDYTFAAVMAGVLALPLAAHAEGTASKTGASNATSAEQTFNAMDTDRSGSVSEAEFITHMQSKENKGPEEAANKFSALDTDNNDRLTLAEVKQGNDAYKKQNIQ